VKVSGNGAALMEGEMVCNQFTRLVNNGDYRGTRCVWCGEKESAHAPSEPTAEHLTAWRAELAAKAIAKAA
jgi:hypothetical protein